ncbi:MAG: arylsulfotransferase family protein, partial [Myxococcota bacterium]|nr:arylsulfotransferase family protein [Myxococcota bacterium]
GILEEGFHLNTIEPFPDEDALLISARNINQLMKIDRNSGEILWTLGEYGDLPLVGNEQFLWQHAPEIQEDGSILLFDNGLTDKREMSRVLVLSYDSEAGVVQVDQEIRAFPDIFAPVWGDADRLANGNILATFGQGGDELVSVIIEFDEAGEELWRLETPMGWGVYRTDRVEDPPTGYVR